MASPEVIAFHAAGMGIDKQRMMNKIRYDAGKGARREDPMFKGLVPNSSGSRNAPFLVHTNQSSLPFEPPVALAMMGREGLAGSGQPGALWNPQGRRYAKAALERRAMDLLAQQEMLPEQEELVPPSAAKQMEKSDAAEMEIDTLRASLLALAQSANKSIQKGTASSEELLSLNRVAQSLIKLGPELSMDDLTDVLQLVMDLKYAYEQSARDGEEFLEGDDALQTEYYRRQVFVDSRLQILYRIIEYLRMMIDGLKRGISDKERKQLSRSAKSSSGIGKISSTVGDLELGRETRRGLLREAGFNIPEEGAVPKITLQRPRPGQTLTREERPIKKSDIYNAIYSKVREEGFTGRDIPREVNKRMKEVPTISSSRSFVGPFLEKINRPRATKVSTAADIAQRKEQLAMAREDRNITVPMDRVNNAVTRARRVAANVRAIGAEDADAEAIRQAARRGTMGQLRQMSDVAEEAEAKQKAYAAASAVRRRREMSEMMAADAETPDQSAIRMARQVADLLREREGRSVRNNTIRQMQEAEEESAADARLAATEAAVFERAKADALAAATAVRQNKRRAAVQRAMLQPK